MSIGRFENDSEEMPADFISDDSALKSLGRLEHIVDRLCCVPWDFSLFFINIKAIVFLQNICDRWCCRKRNTCRVIIVVQTKHCVTLFFTSHKPSSYHSICLIWDDSILSVQSQRGKFFIQKDASRGISKVSKSRNTSYRKVVPYRDPSLSMIWKD